MFDLKITDIDLLGSSNTSRVGELPDCDSLARSMDSVGQLQPVVVLPKKHDKYILVLGFRRLAAASILGWESLQAIECQTDTDPRVSNLIENVCRQGISFWESASAIKTIFPEGVSQSDIAKQLGMSRTWVRPRRKLWELPPEVLLQVEQGTISGTEVASILKYDEEDRESAANKILEKTEQETEKRDRRHPMSIKQLRKMQCIIHDTGREDWMALIKYSLAEFGEKELLDALNLSNKVG